MRWTLSCVVLVAMAGGRAAADDTLDRAAISEGIATVKAKIGACGDASKAGGTVKARVQVAPDGKASATAEGSSDAQLNTCVANAIKTVTFRKTKNGGSFSYPFVFGAPAGAGSGAPTAGRPAPSSDDLDRAAISAGIASARTKITACGDASKVGGMVKAKVQVAPDGKASATADGSADAQLNTCVANAIKTVTFAKTKNGGSFTYPFVFGTKTTPPSSTSANDELDRAAISEGIASVKSKIVACGSGSKAKGAVKVQVTVAPDGSASAVKISQTPDEALGTCVAGVISKATFRKTAKGGSFAYPFVF